MSLLHRASRHSRSSPSITSHFGSATNPLTPRAFLRPNADKANRCIIAFQDQPARGQLQRLATECGGPEVVCTEAQEKAMTVLRYEREMSGDAAVDRHNRVDRREFVCARLDAPLVVGRDEAFLA